jgi:hypothetical protein
MERASNHHASRVDEQLEHETQSLERTGREARAEEFREQEGAGDGEPTPDTLLRGGRDPVNNPGLDHDEVEQRSELARYVAGAFPGDRERLLEVAAEQYAPEQITGRLRALPAGQTYENVEQVWEALGGSTERRF